MNTSKAFLVLVTLLEVTLCNGVQVSRASDPNDGLLIERRIYTFPSYEQAANH